MIPKIRKIIVQSKMFLYDFWDPLTRGLEEPTFWISMIVLSMLGLLVLTFLNHFARPQKGIVVLVFRQVISPTVLLASVGIGGTSWLAPARLGPKSAIEDTGTLGDGMESNWLCRIIEMTLQSGSLH